MPDKTYSNHDGSSVDICYIMSDEFSESPFSQKPYPTPKHKTVKERELEICFFGENEPHSRQEFLKPEAPRTSEVDCPLKRAPWKPGQNSMDT